MEKVKRKIDFTQGGIFLKFLYFVLPIVATNLLQMLYNAADMMVVGLAKHEPNAVGAIGTTNSFIHLIVNIFIGFSVGANVVVAREIGAKNRESTQNAVHTSLVMAVLFGFVGMIIGICAAKPVMQLMGNEGDLLKLSVRYIYIYFIGVPFLALTNYLMAIFRAKGDAKTPLVVLTVAGLLNVGLNLFFVVVVQLSVEGVAIATSVANLFSAIILLVKLRRDQDDTTFSWHKLRIDKGAFKDIVVNGIPAGIQGALFSLSNMFIQSSIVRIDKIKMNGLSFTTDKKPAPIVNGNAAATNLEGFVYTAMNAVYQGAITFTSQNVGAKQIKRVRPILGYALLVVTLIGVILSGFVYVCREPLLGLYKVKTGAAVSQDQHIADLAYGAAVTRFRYICLTYFLCGMMDVCSGVLRGLGKSVTSMVISLLGACLFRLLWVWLVFPQWLTLDCVFVSYPISWLLTCGIALLFIWGSVRKLQKQT